MKIKLLGHEYKASIICDHSLWGGLNYRHDNSVEDNKIHRYFNPLLSRSVREVVLEPSEAGVKIENRKKMIPLPIIKILIAPHMPNGLVFRYDPGYSNAYSKWDKKMFDSVITEDLRRLTESRTVIEAFNKLKEVAVKTKIADGIQTIENEIDDLRQKASKLQLFLNEDPVILKAKSEI